MTIPTRIRRPEGGTTKYTPLFAERDEGGFLSLGSRWQPPVAVRSERFLENRREYYSTEQLDHVRMQQPLSIFEHAVWYETEATRMTVDRNLLIAGEMRIRYACEDRSIYAMVEDIVRKIETDAVFSRDDDEFRIVLPYDDDYDDREDAVYDRLNAELTGREQRDVRFVVYPDQERDDWKLLREACNEPRGNPPMGFKELFDGLLP